jgi:hypothetical protein
LDDPLIAKVKQGIIDARTLAAQESGKVFDVAPLISWIRTDLKNPSDFTDMRKKIILLLTLATMARPDDLMILKRSSIIFIEDYFKMVLLGAKNDSNKRAIIKYVVPASQPDVCIDSKSVCYEISRNWVDKVLRGSFLPSSSNASILILTDCLISSGF